MIKKNLEHGWRVKKNKERGMGRFGKKEIVSILNPKRILLE